MASLPPIKFQAPTQPVEVTAGDDIPFLFRLKVQTVYTNFTGWTMEGSIRDTASNEVKGSIAIGTGISFRDYTYTDLNDVEITVTNGEAVIVIPGTLTAHLRTIKSLSFDLQTIDGATGYKRTFSPMTITGPKDITRT